MIDLWNLGYVRFIIQPEKGMKYQGIKRQGDWNFFFILKIHSLWRGNFTSSFSLLSPKTGEVQWNFTNKQYFQRKHADWRKCFKKNNCTESFIWDSRLQWTNLFRYVYKFDAIVVPVLSVMSASFANLTISIRCWRVFVFEEYIPADIK